MKLTPTQIKNLKILLRAVVCERDGERCLKCKRQPPQVALDLSHIKPKGRHRKMAYLPDNLKLLCRLCHHWWHENPKEAWEWIETILPKERIKRLHQLARSIIYEPLDYERISRELKAQIELFASQP